MSKYILKQENPTGKYKGFYDINYLIKKDKLEVGRINKNENGKYQVCLMVLKNDLNEDGNPNCIWKWVTFKKECDSPEEAILFLNENSKYIEEIYKIHKQ